MAERTLGQGVPWKEREDNRILVPCPRPRARPFTHMIFFPFFKSFELCIETVIKNEKNRILSKRGRDLGRWSREVTKYDWWNRDWSKVHGLGHSSPPGKEVRGYNFRDISLCAVMWLHLSPRKRVQRNIPTIFPSVLQNRWFCRSFKRLCFLGL